MKREELEKYLGQIVEITLFDGEVINGELHKTREEKFKNEPNLYIPNNYYFLINPQSCIFKCSHVKKLKMNKLIGEKQVNKCGNCHLFKNGCEFSESKLPDDMLKNYVACIQYIDENEFVSKLNNVEKLKDTGC